MCAKLDKEYFIKLTLAVYRVTELFLEEELKFQIRESANKVLADLILNRLKFTGEVGRIGYPLEVEKQQAEGESQKPKVSGERSDLVDLLRLFKETETNPPPKIGGGRIDPRNFLVLYREYDKIYQLFAGRRNSGKTVENSFYTKRSLGQNNYRQEKILEVVRENGKVKVSDLSQLFPQFNRRTLIRDLEKLCRGGEVVRVGSNGRGVYYTRQ
jgi:hypothetical protein